MSKKLSVAEQHELISILKVRFENNMKRHKGLDWKQIQSKLESQPSVLWSLGEMEKTGGEPDVVDFDKKTAEYIFFDCSAESPRSRRSFCYDRKALNERKENKPANSALDLAEAMGSAILTEEQYRYLQTLGEFDLKTSSWIFTPQKIRNLGGALFCDRRFDTVFTYHNGAESYYAARGFRTMIRL